MTRAIRFFTLLLLFVGCIDLAYQSIINRRLGAEVKRLEAELGRMPIDDPHQVHLVEIEDPDVPPEVASEVELIWQFRCYLPPGYDYFESSGGGRVAKEGVYHSGGFSSSWGSPQPEPVHKLMTVSFKRKDNFLRVYYSFGGSGGTTTWGTFNPDRSAALVVKKLVNSDQGPRSFGQDTILPLLKIYDPSTAEDKEVGGKILTTYAGGQILISPKSQETLLNILRAGELPSDFDPKWIASEVGNE